MNASSPSWLDLPAARQAAAAGRYGTVLRLARTAAGLTLEQAGKLAGYSAASLSRLETGRRQLTDVTVLRHLSQVLQVPPALFGLADRPGVADHTGWAGTDRVTEAGPRRGGDDPVRRRELLLALPSAPLLAGTAHPPHAAVADPGAALVASMEDLLLRQRLPNLDAGNADTLRSGLTGIKADFQACRYHALAAKLPRLVALAQTSAGTSPHAAAVLAEVYNTATHVLIKLGAAGLGWIASSRAMTAARAGGDPAVIASVTRNVVSLCRREHRYDSAQHFALDAAAQLQVANAAPDPAHLSLYGMLMCNAGYAAAQAGDRSRCAELLDLAATAASRLGGDHNAHWTAFGPTNVTLHRVSAALALGDAGTAIAHAATVPITVIRIPERQARYWLDVARAYHQWAKPAKCYRALIMAERIAPEEIRSRPAVRTLTAELLSTPTQAGMTGLGDFAKRVGVPA